MNPTWWANRAGNSQLQGMTPLCMGADDDLDATLATIEEHVQIPSRLPQVLAQRRRLRVNSGKQQSLVAVQLCHRFEAAPLSLQFTVIGFLEVRDADQPAVVAIGPAVIGAGEGGGIAGIRAAQPVAAMTTDVQES